MLEALNGPLRLESSKSLPVKALLAPMEGVMTPLLCAAADSLGLVDVWMAPFVAVSGGSIPSVKALRKRLERFVKAGRPAVAQILGRDAAAIAACAAGLRDAGFEFINLNFACPSGFVVKGGAGGAMLKSPRLLSETVAEVKRACGDGVSVSAKLRSGWSSPGELSLTIPAVRDAGADFAIVHYRTVLEGYKELPGLACERIALAASLAGTMPLLGNGDVNSPQDAEAMLSKSSCSGVAVARGFLSDPYLLLRLLGRPAPSLEEGRAAFLGKMVELAVAGEAPWVRKNVLELGRAMFGAGSARFKALCATSDEELLSGSFPFLSL